ncbi:MAG: polyprenol monophosphomannose synthase [Terriglobales bacterium]
MAAIMAENLSDKSADFDLKLIPTPTGSFCVPKRDEADATTRVSVVLPTFNEAQNIEAMIRAVSDVLEGCGIDYELIVVDDDSPDGTWRRALSLSGSFPRLRVMRRVNERGLATAVIRGWQASNGDVLGVLDADLQHPPEILPQLWSQMESGADLAVGSRHVPGGGVSNWSLRRRLISRAAQGIGLLVLPEVVGRLADPMSGFLLVRRDKLAGVTLSPRGYKILIEIIARSKIGKIAEVGYVFQERLGNQSKVTWRSYRDYLLHLGVLRFRQRSS